MDALTLFIMVMLVGGALALILYPVWQQTRPEAIFRMDRSGQTLEEYEARYQALLAAIKDLMFDYEMGKVSAGDYEVLLSRTKLEAANVRRQIDRLSQQAGAEADPSLEAEIEALVAQMRRTSLNGSEALQEEVEAEVELLKNVKPGPHSVPAQGTSASGLNCPNCSQSVQADDAFCARCGQSLAELQAVADEDVCPDCGYSHEPDDLFCARCGTVLKEGKKSDPEDAKTTELPA